MNVREKLDIVRKIKNEIARLEEKCEEYEQKALSIPGQDFTRERVQTTRNLDAPFVKWIYKKIETEEKLKKTKDKLILAQVETMNFISEINNTEYELILIYRYVDLMYWDEIASKIHLANSTVFKYHKDAISMLEKIYS